MRTIEHWIGGTATAGTGATSPVWQPATGQPQSLVPLGTTAEVNAAVDAARKAFDGWAQLSLARRTRVLFAFRNLVERYEDDLARIVSAEHGKVLDDARGEVVRGREVIEFACGIPHLLKGDYSDQVSTNVDTFSLREPLGVCVGITPFNFPVMVPMWMHPVAIACGNTFVLKPSERDPSVSLRIAELYAEAGLPDGVFNVVHGDHTCVDALLEHPDVAAVSFVGSTPVAEHIYRRGTATGKRVQALGGAKNHAVVLPDADLDDAATQITAAAYGSAGQRCMAVSVAVAVGSAADPLVERLTAATRRVRVGPGDDPDSDLGPVVSAQAAERIRGLVDGGVAAGAELVVDGRASVPDDGFYVGPCLFDRVTPQMEIYRAEIFGPVLAVVRVDTLDEAVALVNANPYGNGTAVFTRSGDTARRYQRAARVGMIGINVPVPVPMAYYSFGGWKASLFGDTHVHGAEGVSFYTRGKVVTSRWPRPETGDSTAYHFPTAV